ITGYAASQLVYVAAKLGLADLLAEGPQSVERLAERTRTDRGSLYRVMRGLAAVGVLRETGAGLFELSEVGVCLRKDVPGSLGAMALCSDESYSVWGHLLHTVTTGETAFRHAYGVSRYQYLEQHPEAAGSFNRAMAGLAAQLAAALIAAYDFSTFARVVDVGGGSGALLKAILKANPKLSGVLCDTPNIVADAAGQLSGEDLGGRCEVVAGDFFESVPAGGDLYILSHVLHNWDDESCRRILRNCRAAVAPGGRLLVAEIVMPARPENSFNAYPLVMTDLQMLVMTGGRERGEEEFRALLSAAGFEMTRVIPTRGLDSLIECAPV
ncbi:MAG TPA: methyltransferase, partial [Pyrinomonadaceae bacterium]